jgi:hypothetical protein
MYFWACWFNRRYRLIAYLAGAVVVTVLATLPAGLERHEGRWVLTKITSHEQVVKIWQTGTGNTLVALLVILLFVAADLGALGLGDDSERRNLDFLLTRPRSRGQLVWAGWLAGLTQLLPLLIVPLLTCLLVLAAMTHELLSGEALRLSVPLFAMAAAMYTLAFSMATLTASARHGYELAALVVVLYVLYVGYRFAQSPFWWGGWYYRWDSLYLYGVFDWYVSPHQLFPLANLLFLSGAVFLLPYCAQLGFARRDW